jgi:hypothetical protein
MNLGMLNIGGSSRITDSGLMQVTIVNIFLYNSYIHCVLQLMQTVPSNSIVVLEDVDSVFVKREHSNNDTKVTFSGLLNALDGVASSEGQVLFMTTNRIFIA